MRTPESITFLPTNDVQNLARKAMEIQDAVNGVAIVNFFLEVQRHFRDNRDTNKQGWCGGDIALQNPISIALLNKLNDLAGMSQSKDECFPACMELAEGKEVLWTVRFLD